MIHNPYESLYRIVLTLSRKCNYNCNHCPQSNPNLKYKDGYMKLDTIKQLIISLNNKFSGIFSISGFGEPTLNPEFLDIIDYLHTIPNTKIDIISNGTDLNALINCAADTIHISVYNKESYDYLLSNTKQYSNIILLKKYKFNNFNNRAGNALYVNNNPILDTCCNLPFMKISIDYNGDILKCCSDWNKDFILGNIYNDDIWDIWINKLKDDRYKLMYNKRKDVILCNKCNANGQLYGNQYVDFWREYYEHC